MSLIKAHVLDIDGVLCSSKKLHEIAFCRALKKFNYSVTEDFHKNHLDGLPTKVKLDVLHIVESERAEISAEKQKLTFELAENFIKFNQETYDLFKELKEKGYKIGICTNSIRQFAEKVVEIMKLTEFTDVLLSNEDVIKPKPDPEIYIKCINMLQVEPNRCIIYEDSKFGLEAAFKSLANVQYVKNPSYLKEKVRLWL